MVGARSRRALVNVFPAISDLPRCSPLLGSYANPMPIFSRGASNNSTREHEWLLEPGQTTSRTLTVRAKLQCPYSGETVTSPVEIDSASTDVIGFR